MAVRKKYFGTWKSTLPILSVSFWSLILVVVEEVIDGEFKCPQRNNARIYYSLAFFFVPALIFLVLSLILQQDFIDWLRCSEKHRWDRKCEIVGKAFGAALLWCVILLIDGRYAECINRALKGSSTEPTAQTMPAQPPSEAYILSQVFGLFALFLIIFVYGLYTLYPFWFCCKEKEKRKQTESQRIREEQAQICMSKEEKYVQEIVQNVLVSKFQDHLKNVPNDTSIRGIFEEVQNFLNQPATAQTTQMDTELEVRFG
ncbi:unnamed protein product [Lepidochelys olivacea]